MVHGPEQLETAFAQVAREKVAAVIVQPSLPLEPAAELALKHRLPAVAGSRPFAVAGGLLFYGANAADQYRKAATYVDKILKGASPADLPVEQPTKFELVINLKTAKALGLTLPVIIQMTATDVIE
jgi:putative ABC transport system substrate-binding protein